MFALLQIWRFFWWPLLQTHYFFLLTKKNPTGPLTPSPRHLLTISYIYSLCIPLHFNLFTILWYVACYLHFVNRSFTSNSVILKSFQSFNFKPQDFPLKLSQKTEVNLKFAGKPEKIPSFCFKNRMLTGKCFKKWAKKPKHKRVWLKHILDHKNEKYTNLSLDYYFAEIWTFSKTQMVTILNDVTGP